MAHKVHPYGFRIGIIKPWLAKWYADRDYATLLQEDMRIRELVARQLSNASVSQLEIERGINHVTVTWLIPRSISTWLTLALESCLATSSRIRMSSWSSVA